MDFRPEQAPKSEPQSDMTPMVDVTSNGTTQKSSSSQLAQMARHSFVLTRMGRK